MGFGVAFSYDPYCDVINYNVWAVRGGSCAQLVGRSTLPLYDLDHPLFAISDGGEQFIVQPVSTSGLAAPLSLPAC